jgi:hypothetical protein
MMRSRPSGGGCHDRPLVESYHRPTVRLPPLITWSDVRWILFVVAGIAFLYGVLALSVAALKVGGVWGWAIVIAGLAVIVALIGRELWAFWLRLGR